MRKPCNAKYCGTCRNWCGDQDWDSTNRMIEFDDDEKAKCTVVHGVLKRGGTPVNCPKWEQRFR